VLSGAAPLSDSAAAESASILGIAPTEFCGSTETGAIGMRRRDQPDPAWRCLPGVRIERMADGCMRVFTTVLGEAGHETADLVELEPDGGFRLRGRVDRVAKIEGKRVSLGALERDLKAVESVADAAIIALGEAPPELAAIVVPSAAGAARIAEIGAFRFQRELRAALARQHDRAALPRRWRIVDALPVDALGKRPQRVLAALFDLPPRPTEPVLRGEQRTESGIELALGVPGDLAQLAGHFPSQPIVPGVALIDWAVRLAARHLGLDVDAARRFRVKFHRPLRPGMSVTLSLRRVAAERLAFAYREGEALLSAGEIRLDPR
jgi:hypothetical protein